jgi:hypothetical protein
VNKLISIFNCTSHLNPCTFGIPEGNARTIAPYSLVYQSFLGKQGRHSLSVSKSETEWGHGGEEFYLLYVNAEIKQSARKDFYRTVKGWFGIFQVKIPTEYLGMIRPEKFTFPFFPGCRGLAPGMPEVGVSNSCVILDEIMNLHCFLSTVQNRILILLTYCKSCKNWNYK